MWKFDKKGYDFIASSEGESIVVENISGFKFLRNAINWLLTDIGFNYKTKINGAEYSIKSSLGGWGYTVNDNVNKLVGKVDCKSVDNASVVCSASNENFQIEKDGSSGFAILKNKNKIGEISLDKKRTFPLVIDLEEQPVPVLNLLVFFAVLKCL